MSHVANKINTAIHDDMVTTTHQNAGIVIIGAGMAGSRFAIELARARSTLPPTSNSESPTVNSEPTSSVGIDPKYHHNSVPITLISKEPQVGYNRIMLSPVLAGDRAFDDTYLYDQSDYQSLGITVLAGVTVNTMDTTQQRIELSNGQVLSYTKAVIATGSTARVIPFPNHTAPGVHVFRDVADVTALTDYAKQGKTGLVIGGGVLGLEAACALANQGAKMTVVHVYDYVLNRQLDFSAAALLQAELSRRHVGLVVSANSESIVVNQAGEVSGLLLKDGRTLAADFIVMAVGVMPNITLAKNSGLDVNRGIIVNEFMHTSCANVYAIGECVELAGELFGMVAPVNQQVDTLVSVLKHEHLNETKTSTSDLRAHWQPFVSKPLSLKLKVSGVAAFSAGQIAFDEDEANMIETLVYRQPVLNHYHCLYLKANKLVGAVLYGDVDDGSFYSQLISDQTDITPIKETLIFGAAYCDLDDLNTLNNNVDELNDFDVVDDVDNDSSANAETCESTSDESKNIVPELVEGAL